MNALIEKVVEPFVKRECIAETEPRRCEEKLKSFNDQGIKPKASYPSTFESASLRLGSLRSLRDLRAFAVSLGSLADQVKLRSSLKATPSPVCGGGASEGSMTNRGLTLDGMSS